MRKLGCTLLLLAGCSGEPSLILSLAPLEVNVAMKATLQCGGGPSTEMEECKTVKSGSERVAFTLKRPEGFERSSVLCGFQLTVLDECDGIQLLTAQLNSAIYGNDAPTVLSIPATGFFSSYDDDGDGATNWVEHLAGSDPKSAASKPGQKPGGQDAGQCVPKSCQELGFQCGTPLDNCGTELSCGDCTGANERCGANGAPNRCSVPIVNGGCNMGDGPYGLRAAPGAPMPFSYTAFQSAVPIEGDLVVFPRSEVYAYRTALGRWETIGGPPPDNDREGPTAGAGNKLYVVGGHGGRTVFADVDVFDVSTKTWSSLPDLPEPRASALALVHDSNLYVIGGEAVIHGAGQTNVWRLNLQRPQQWETMAPLPSPRVYATGVSYASQLYVIGGADFWQDRGAKPAIEMLIYRTDINQWSVGPRTVRGAGSAGAAVLCGALYLVGGTDERGNTSNRIDVNYPIGESTWYTGATMPLDLGGMGVAAVGERLYVFGGWSNSLNSWTNTMYVGVPMGRLN